MQLQDLGLFRETCQKLNIISQFSYRWKVLFKLGIVLRIKSVDIRINKKTRDSRLFRNVPEFIFKSTSTILMMFLLYRPGDFFHYFQAFS